MNVLRLSLVLLLVPLAQAGSHTASIVATAQKTPELAGLVTALTLPDQKPVLDALQGTGPFTVFAPTNGGFEALKTLKNSQGMTLYDFVTKAENKAVLTKILQYHVLSGETKAAAAVAAAQKNAKVKTLLGEEVTLSMKDGKVMVDDSEVTATDVMATNGVVHLINTVLVPPSLRSAVADFKASIVATAQATAPLKGLVTALTLPGQKPVLDALQGTGPFTVFAPTNGGFEALKMLKNGQGMTLYDFVTKPENKAVLTKILQYHVLSGETKAAAAVPLAQKNAKVKTLLGEEVTLSMKDGKVMVDDSEVTTTDVMTSNGVVHLIKNVLVPPSLRSAVAGFKPVAADLKSIVATAQATPSLKGLVTALTLKDQKPVLDALQGTGPFTVFAPTNGGFEALKMLKNGQGMTLYDFVTKAENKAVLTKILQYHVLSGEVKAAAATELAKKNTKVETLLGEKITLSMKKRRAAHGAKVMVDNSVVTMTDVMASNGVVHLIDNVLVPPSLASAVAAFKATKATPAGPPPAQVTPSPPSTTSSSASSIAMFSSALVLVAAALCL